MSAVVASDPAAAPAEDVSTAVCARCGKSPATRKCGTCNAVFWCSAGHKKKDRKKHLAVCSVRQAQESKAAQDSGLTDFRAGFAIFERTLFAQGHNSDADLSQLWRVEPHMKAAAAHGYLPAHVFLMMVYVFQQDADAAKRERRFLTNNMATMLRHAKEHGAADPEYTHAVATYYIHQHSPEDEDRAALRQGLDLLRVVADGGHRHAMYELGMVYQQGMPLCRVKKDPAKARQLFEAATAKGHVLSRLCLSHMLWDGASAADVAKDRERALALLEANCEDMHGPSFVVLASHYMTLGRYGDALTLLKKGSKTGNRQAAAMLQKISYSL